jgi:hypothetical protein
MSVAQVMMKSGWPELSDEVSMNRFQLPAQ